MEQVQSLINRLSFEYGANASIAELVATTELLRIELMGAMPQNGFNLQDAVAVWLPVGYTKKSVEVVLEKQVVKNDVAESPVETSPVPVPIIAPFVVKEIQPEIAAPKVPVPPAQIVVEKESPSLVSPEAPILIKEENNGFYQLHLDDDDDMEPVIPLGYAQRIEPVTKKDDAETAATDAPPAVVLHLEMPEDEEGAAFFPDSKPAPQKTSIPFPQYPEDASVLMKHLFPLSVPPQKPVAGKEINEMVADAAAIPLYQKLQQTSVEMGQVLAEGPKITDLRKAFTINDKYQMINSLFRNDEDMFERSVRTINNFGSLPEARFWMQRELVLKLGWNEQDEMVQQFYRLVNRRFA